MSAASPVKRSRPRPVFTREQMRENLKRFLETPSEKPATRRRRRGEPVVIPKTGAPSGILAAALSARQFVRPYQVAAWIYVPLDGEPHRAVRVRAVDHKMLTEHHGMQGSRWFQDRSGAIRAYPRSGPGRDTNESFDVVAVLYGLEDGDTYSMSDPLNLVPEESLTIHRAN